MESRSGGRGASHVRRRRQAHFVGTRTPGGQGGGKPRRDRKDGSQPCNLCGEKHAGGCPHWSAAKEFIKNKLHPKPSQYPSASPLVDIFAAAAAAASPSGPGPRPGLACLVRLAQGRTLLVDTGSQLSFVHSRVTAERQPSKLQVQSFFGESVPILGSANLPLPSPLVELAPPSVPALVVASTPHDADWVLGTDLLLRLGGQCGLDLNRGQVRIGGDSAHVVLSLLHLTTSAVQSAAAPVLVDGPSPAECAGSLTRDQLRANSVAKFPHLPALGSHSSGFEHCIQLRDEGATPPVVRYGERTPAEKAEIRSIVNDLLEKGVIRRSTSPYRAPVVLVKKGDGSTRMCVDYQRLNALTVPDAYPMPRVDALLTWSAGR